MLVLASKGRLAHYFWFDAGGHLLFQRWGQLSPAFLNSCKAYCPDMSQLLHVGVVVPQASLASYAEQVAWLQVLPT